MNRFLVVLTALGAMVFGTGAWAANYSLPSNKSSFRDCGRAIHDTGEGHVLLATYAPHEGKPYYRYQVKQNDQSEWMLLCDGETGVIVLRMRLDVWPATVVRGGMNEQRPGPH